MPDYWFLVLMFLLFLSCCVLGVVLWRLGRFARRMCLLEDSLDAGGAGLVFFDERERFCFVNGQAKGFLSFLENPDGLTLSQFLNYLFDHAEDVGDDFRYAVSRSRQDDEGAGFCEIVRADSGDLCLVEAQNTQRNRTAILIHDLSGIKAQEERLFTLNKINHDLVQAIESSTCAVLLTDPKTDPHSVVFLNDACCDVLRMGKKDALGLSLDSVFGRIGVFDPDDEIKAAVQDANSCQKEIVITIDGEKRWYDVRLTPVFDGFGKLDLFVTILTDLTALKMKEEDFFKAQKLDALGRLAAGVAHDFNNLLSIIDGYARMTTRCLDDHDKARENLRKIQTASQRGANLTRKMLTFTHHRIVNETVIDIKGAFFEQRTLIEPMISSAIELSMICDDDTLYAECSEDSLAQIVLNLAINARDAMPDGGRLEVSLGACEGRDCLKLLPESKRDKAFLCLRVLDTGEGMTADVVEHIFDPFFTTKEQGKGTGLGLSVVYGLVRDFGGEMHVRSAPDEGTCFYVFIPRSGREPDKQLSGVVDDVDSLSFKGYTALVAEDEDDLRGLVCGVLEQHGMEVLSACDGDDALMVQDDYEGKIDLLITDVVMPGMNGLKLADLMLSLREGVQVIYMSGYPASGDMARVDLPEDSLFLPKPLDCDLLCQLVFACLNQKGGDSPNEFLKMTAGHWEMQKASEG